MRRSERRNRLKVPGSRKGKHFTDTPVGERANKFFIGPLADHLIGVLDQAPGGLAEALKQVPPGELAQAVLNPLLHKVLTDWEGIEPDDARRELCHAVGRHLHALFFYKALLRQGRVTLARTLTERSKRHRRQPGEAKRKPGRKRKSDARDLTFAEWETIDFVGVGDWFVDQAMAMPYFVLVRRKTKQGSTRLPAIAPEYQRLIEEVRQELIRADLAQLPDFDEPPPDWVSFRHGPLSFVDDTRRETREAIEQAFTFTDGGTFVSEHVAGVNALGQVAYKLNLDILKLVEEFAAEILTTENGQTFRNAARVREDVAFAKVIGERPFYMRHFCDWRGRVFPVPYLHYQRGDHVRALFLFASGAKLGGRRAGARPLRTAGSPPDSYYIPDDRHVGGYTDLEMLEIHCANTHGEDKLSFKDRLKWVDDNRHEIERIARNPRGELATWRQADSPFCYAAACLELVAAWGNPDFETQLPIAFDCSANGPQHLALLAGDADAAAILNLIDTAERQDPYGLVAERVRVILEGDDRSNLAGFWRGAFARLTPRQVRAIAKQPVMTYGYGVENVAGQIAEAYYKLFPEEREIRKRRKEEGETLDTVFGFLADKIDQAIQYVLPGVAASRQYLRDLSEYCVRQGGFLPTPPITEAPPYLEGGAFVLFRAEPRFLEWTSATGFPILNSYFAPDVVRVYVGGSSLKVANSDADEIKVKKTIRSAAPNYVHSMDASHMIRVVLAAREADIANIMPIHDSFGCLASDAANLNRIIRREMFLLYYGGNGRVRGWLEDLRINNGVTYVPPLPIGDYDPEALLAAEYLSS